MDYQVHIQYPVVNLIDLVCNTLDRKYWEFSVSSKNDRSFLYRMNSPMELSWW